MDQFSSQLANNLENGYTAGVPEHLIQVYKELSAWCELIQYKIDVDINTQDDIRKQVLSNNLLKHIQGLWQEKVNEFYSIKRDEAMDNLSKAYQNRINNSQKVTEDDIQTVIDDDCSYDGTYVMSSNDEYFNDNDSLSSEEDYLQQLENISSETTIKDDKMVVVVKYNAEPKRTKVVEDYAHYDDEYEFDYGNDDYDYNDEYDEYDLHHYREANVTKVSINYTSNLERDNNFSHFREYYERPNTPSLPEWSENDEDDATCAADFLNNNAWDYDNHYYDHEVSPQKEIDDQKNLSYTEQIIREQRRLSLMSFSSVEDDNASICSIKNNEDIHELNELYSKENKDEHNISENVDHLSSSLVNKETKETEKEMIKKNEESHEENDENVESVVSTKFEKHRLSITIDESVINSNNKERNEEELIYDKDTPTNNMYKEHLYPRTIKSRDIYYADYEDSPTTDSAISPNEELLLSSATDEDFSYEYSSKKVLMTPLSADVFSYSEAFYSPEIIEEEEEEEELLVEDDMKMKDIPSEDLLSSTQKVVYPTTEEKDTEDKEESLAKYLSSRRDSGFSETCDEPFIIGV